MDCLDSVKNVSFDTFLKTKSEFFFFGMKNLEKNVFIVNLT
jgi:hypothetical protein